MTTTSQPAGGQHLTPAPPAPVEMVTGSIDGYTVTVPKGTMIIRAAELIGIQVPRFCDHPLLEPVAMCRMCLVEVSPGPPKPQPACAIPLGQDMVVKTQLTSPMADAAQEGVMEFILANHPLDCPVCDKGGECPLQNQAMSNGRSESRYTLPKNTFDKPINVSAQILLDRERCVNCARCTRFTDQIAGDPFITLQERGSQQQVAINPDYPFDSYFSGNTVQICPVGALTSARYRFRARPFDLVSVPTVCEHCASGCSLRTDVRRSAVMRRQAGDDPQVNEEWNCDKGRFAFPYQTMGRLQGPLVREDGQLRPASWPEAIDVAARGLAAARGSFAALTGGRLTLEDNLAYSAFTRAVMGSDNVDFRARPAAQEEAAFLASRVAGSGLGVSYRDLQNAPVVVLVAFEPEEESPIVFLRLRKATRSGSLSVISVAPFVSNGLSKLDGRLVIASPGGEPAALRSLADEDALSAEGSILLVGERAAEVPGLLSEVAAVADRSGARIAWVPRRAGERGAVEAGLLPGLLPGGRSSDSDADRVAVAEVLGVGVDVLPDSPGLDGEAVIDVLLQDADARAKWLSHSREVREAEPFKPELAALMVAGVDPSDMPAPQRAQRAIADAPFLVSLETRTTAVTEAADVVLPVGVVTEKEGTFVNWEGRLLPFGKVLEGSDGMSDARVLAMLADAIAAYLDEPATALASGDVADLRGLLLGPEGDTSDLNGQGERAPIVVGPQAPEGGDPAAGEPATESGSGTTLLLATWRELIDLGTMQQGEPYLAATAHPPSARISPATAAHLGLDNSGVVTISTDQGSITLGVAVTDMPDDTVWLPTNSPGSSVRNALAAGWGDTVAVSRGGEV